ncbi:hypothetical protein [Oenococcus oeni]|uniref:hypothetical protein n=1 Tax=Oenococcus oeni TaxID=1247 RepID=UPI0010B9812A|nr:hypothetical protein [Oenococcus oeni]SYW14181.1 hypothetical protein OENI_370005 [Oenococcus oeni]
MEYISVNPVVQFSEINSSYFLFFSASEFKYFKFPWSKELSFILYECARGTNLQKFINDAIEKNYKLNNIAFLIKVLTKKKIIVQRDIPFDFDFDKYSIPELAVNSRYGYQIAYLEKNLI